MGNVYNMVGGGGGIKLQSIAVTTPPTKTSYLSGESFDPAGMVVTATYSNGAKLAATGYAVEPSGPLSDGMTSVTIRYTEGGRSVTTTQAVTVIPKLVSIAVTTPPTKTAYRYGEAFSAAGMVVTATYTDGNSAAVTGYTTSPASFISLGDQSVTVKYTENGVSVAVTTPVTVSRAVISTVPSQSGSLTYTGSALSPSWNNYNSAQLALGGTTSATNAGTYTATFTPTSNYEWSDGTTTAKSVSWTIGKAAGSLSISPTSLTLNTSNPTGKITVTRAGNGTITAESSNTGIVTVSVSGNEVTVNNVNQTSGSATVTIKVSAGTNHTAPGSKTCEITAAFVSSVLNDNDWATIRQVSDNGQGQNYWSIGDRKAEPLNGTVGSLTLNGTYYPFIVDFDHNKSKESPNAHTITFQFAKSALTGGADIAFVDGSYNSTGSSAAFRMNTTNTNSGGWTGSYMKKTLMPAFKSACSAALRAVIKPVTIYSDNVGGGSNTASNVTASSEEFYLPAEFEVHGARSYANSAEQNYQTQLAYYKAGNSKVKYKHNATGTAAVVWCRSARYNNSTIFCIVNTSGDASTANAYYSLGVAPLCNV
ncbi:MAG: bacterial Ig-like domain-containing protein [Oscillospiraceae bacterium]